MRTKRLERNMRQHIYVRNWLDVSIIQFSGHYAKKKKKISEKVFLRVFHRMDILFLTIYPFRG